MHGRMGDKIRHRWKSSGPLVTLRVTIGSTIPGVAILVYGTLAGDLAARFVGTIATTFAAALILMSLFAKLTRKGPVESPHERLWSILNDFILGLGGALAWAYGVFAVRFGGKPAIPYGWFATWGLLAVVLSFALNGWGRHGPFKSAVRRRHGILVISFGVILLVLTLLAPLVQETPGFTAGEVESILLPIPAALLINGWAKTRGYS